MMRLFCDVDGTLNAEIGETTRADVITNNRPLRLRWREDYVSRLAALSHLPEVEWIWATAWMGEAPRVLDPLWNINSSGFIDWDDDYFDTGQFGKSEGIRMMQEASPTPFIFVDDWAISDELLRLPWWMKMERREDVLLVRPNHWTGVNLADVEAIEGFVERWA